MFIAKIFHEVHFYWSILIYLLYFRLPPSSQFSYLSSTSQHSMEQSNKWILSTRKKGLGLVSIKKVPASEPTHKSWEGKKWHNPDRWTLVSCCCGRNTIKWHGTFLKSLWFWYLNLSVWAKFMKDLIDRSLNAGKKYIFILVRFFIKKKVLGAHFWFKLD